MDLSWLESSSGTGRNAAGAPRSRSAILAHTASSTCTRLSSGGGGGGGATSPGMQLVVCWMGLVWRPCLRWQLAVASQPCMSKPWLVSLASTCDESVLMAFMISLWVGCDLSSVINLSSDDAGSSGSWAFFLFLVLIPFLGLLCCLLSLGTVVES